ncbi:MAG: VWA domain-containing protein [Acidobacteria bacterium]|nr:VWA domain-containing protein [Acidobacteriota bacterium]
MRRFLLLLSLVVLSAAVTAQQPQQPPAQPAPAGQQPGVTFRAETNFVEVHAIVTDQKTGAFVGNLTQADFEIYEDGRLQAPIVFSLVDVPIERPFTPANASAPVEPDVRATTRNFDGRIYVLIMDDLHTYVTRTNNVREIAKRFIDQYLGVNDLAAVIFTSGRQESGQELTNNRALLKAAIDRLQGLKLPSAGAERLAIHLRESGFQDSSGDEQQGQANRSPEGLQRAQSIRDPYDEQRAFNARRAFDAIQNVSRWLADVQGRRKALLLFSEGFDYDIYQPFWIARNSDLIITEAREAVAAAQRANVNVYGIDPRGMSTFPELVDISGRSDYPQLEYGNFRGQLRELLLAQESLISLSEETGGLAIVNSGDLAGGLGRIVLDNSRYYLLGYYSDSTKWSRNKFLNIEVKVKRPGVEVRARKGYLPPDARAIERAREADVEAGTSPALRAALSKPVPVGELPLRAFAGPLRSADNKGQVLISVEIDGSGLKYQERNGRFAESVEVSIVAADERARVQGGDRQTFNLNLMPETRERVNRSGVRLISQVTVPPGRYQIRIGAQEATGGAVGTLPYDVEVPDYARTPFSMSGLFITSSVSGAVPTGSTETDWNGLLPAPPVATRTFSPGETLTWFAEVYDNSTDQPHAVNYTSTIADARDGRTIVQARDNRVVQRRGQGHGFTTDYPLRDLKPGMYVLRVEAAATMGNHVARREVLFEVK